MRKLSPRRDPTCSQVRKLYTFAYFPVLLLAFKSSPASSAPTPPGAPLLSVHALERDKAPSISPFPSCSHTMQPSSWEVFYYKSAQHRYTPTPTPLFLLPLSVQAEIPSHIYRHLRCRYCSRISQASWMGHLFEHHFPSSWPSFFPQPRTGL